MNRKWLRAAIGTLVIAGVLITFPSFGRFGRSQGDVPKGIEVENGEYIDGVYTGEAAGFRPGLMVEVEIREGEITRIGIVDHNEIGPQYWRRPMEIIPDAIVRRQTTSVDAVGGATATSYGIMSAVETALNKAAK